MRLNYPFNIESILDDLTNDDYWLVVTYDGTVVEGWLTREFDKNAGQLRYVVFDLDKDVHHFLDLPAIRRLEISIN